MAGKLVKSELLLALALLALQTLVGCAESAASGPAEMQGHSCQLDSQCAGGSCLDGRCSKPCTSDADCASDEGLVCGVTASGEHGCVAACESLNSKYACVDGVPTSCEVAPPTSCKECGCSSALRCEVGVGCLPKRAVGEPCTLDGDCNTNNCSSFAGVCRQPVGSACTPDNCDTCMIADGWSFCSRQCATQAECGAALCYQGGCKPLCTVDTLASCPGQKCSYTYDQQTKARTNTLYCDCAYAGTCSSKQAPHPLGQRCDEPSDCESNQCDRVRLNAPGVVNMYEGMCSKACESSDDCGAGFTCAAANPALCLPICTGSCALGNCVGLPTTEGTTEGACWIKRENDDPCWEWADCLSGNCVAGKCAPPDGQTNGKACTANGDCKSMSCVSGACRGTAVLGEACAMWTDCAVGTCCLSGASANTCATQCP